MRAMKDSGIKWIGEIPKEWDLIRAKNLFEQSTTKGNNRLVLLSATQDRGVIDKSMLESVVQVSADADLSTFKTVHINDFVISLRSFQGGFEISYCEGVISPAYTVFRLRTPSYPHYYRYLFKSYGFIDKINSLTVGIREGKNIQYKDFANMMLPSINIDEQQRIATYLDTKCGEIDELIGIQEKFIEELKAYKQSVITEAVTKGLNPNAKMKDSGVEWIGEIPEEWEVAHLNYFVSKVGSGSTPRGGSNIYVSEGIKFLRSQNVYFEGLVLDDVAYITPEIDEEMKNTRVKCGDVLLNITGGSIGRCFFVDKKLGAANVNQHVCIIRPTKMDCVYLKYYLQSQLGQIQIDSLQTGGNREGLSAAALKKFLVFNISKEEQQSIATYLDNKCSQIDSLIALKQSKIEELKSFKKSLIYEYVTGKKTVPETV